MLQRIDGDTLDGLVLNITTMTPNNPTVRAVVKTVIFRSSCIDLKRVPWINGKDITASGGPCSLAV